MELFATFFPDKKFLGPSARIDGGIDFPVQIGDSSRHDIDDLSSGEKEILYGYLRLYNSSPKNYVVLLDEPELHLNPKLIRMLPQFYYRHLGVRFDSQIWLITHSDALLRDVIGNSDYSVFHMIPQSQFDGLGSQAIAISGEDELEKAVIDLVGDAAAYTPGAPAVIFESESSEFDIRMVTLLFPKFAARCNLIAGTNKRGVNGIYKILDRLHHENRLKVKVYAITDKDDRKAPLNVVGGNAFEWDVYHIENYLIEPEIITSVLRSLSLETPSDVTLEEITSDLRESARDTMPSLIAHSFRAEANAELVRSLNLRVDLSDGELHSMFTASIGESRARLEQLIAAGLSPDSVRARVDAISKSFEVALEDGSWRRIFRGRDILKRLLDRRGETIKYEYFRNLIINSMKEAGYIPEGMAEVLQKIRQN
jgi:hypothetical protein